MNEFIVNDRADLYQLKQRSGLDRVVIHTAQLLYRNLLPHALKYGIWALAPGGTLVVRDQSPNVFELWPRFISFKLVRQWAHKLLAEDAEPVSLDIAAGEITFRRTRPPTPPGWSAGVVFSGQAAELPQLRACLDALLLQPELTAEHGGEIMVSGPAEAADCLGAHPQVHYHVHDLPPGPRVMIGQKKNALIRALKGPRIAILHSRIQLEPDTLRHVAPEFEIATPRVLAEGRAGLEDYLSLGVHDTGIPGHAPRLTPSSLRRVPPGRYLDLYAEGPPYVDGGVFLVRKDVHAACPLHEAVAWDEAEDLEWCMRAVVAGYLIDLMPEARAVSAVGKLRGMPLPPALAQKVRDAKFALQAGRYRMRDRMERWLGRR